MIDPMSPNPTESLIDRLASELKPTGRSAVSKFICLGLVAGACVSALAVLWLWGVRPDMPAALSSGALWLKEGFVVALAGAGIFAMIGLARPDGTAGGPAWIAIGAACVMALLAVLELAGAPPAVWKTLMMGKTWATCPWLILALAVPVLIGSICAMRSMAPTRLRLAGAACGLASGALSALVYSVACDESAVAFVFIWYGGAIVLATLAGAWLGPRVLRW